jgi:hypothetical protein
MLARDALTAAFRDAVVPLLRAAGFKGTYPTWRRAEESGDVAIVNLQAGSYNESGFGEFYVNLAAVPEPWWAWQSECYAVVSPLAGEIGNVPAEYNGLYRSRLAPRGTRTAGTHRWTVTSTDGARDAAADIAAALVASGLPTLTTYLDRGRLLDALRTGQLEQESAAFDRPGMRDVALAVLLSDIGGPELDLVCDRLTRFRGAPGWQNVSTATAAWATDRASSRSRTFRPAT